MTNKLNFLIVGLKDTTPKTLHEKIVKEQDRLEIMKKNKPNLKLKPNHHRFIQTPKRSFIGRQAGGVYQKNNRHIINKCHRRSNERNPEKYRARYLTGNAIRDKRLIKKPHRKVEGYASISRGREF